MEQVENLCVSFAEPILTVSCELKLAESIHKINNISKSLDIPYPQIIASSEYEPNKTRIMFTGHKDWIFILNKNLENHQFKVLSPVQFGLFISGFGLSSSNYEQQIFAKLAQSNLKVQKFIKDAKGLLLIFDTTEKETVQNFAEELI